MSAYPHDIKVRHKATSADGGGGFTEGATTTVYDDKADVQDAGRNASGEQLTSRTDGGLQGKAQAVVFLPPAKSISGSGILEGHEFEWVDESKTGRVTRISHLDDSFEVAF